ncbi:MAG: demethoxyubiquinone hydroxylase family protein [Alphaproteobacteria bacterium]
MSKRKTSKSPGKTANARKAIPGHKKLERILRVDHAGEFGAQRIYAGQLSILGKSAIGDELRHMAAQEDEHLRAFSALLNERKIRPTALHPLWHVAGFALGAGTALLGEKAAMGCTVAVEEVIDEHYRQQLAALGPGEAKLKALIEKFRREENEHKDAAAAHGAETLPYYPVLRAFIRAGSKAAIWLSERL